MKLISGPRQSGKTTEMIRQLMLDEKRVLCTFSTKEQDRLRKEYPKINPERIIYWRDYKTKYLVRQLHGSKVIIDNIEHVLEDAIGDWVEIGTITGTDKTTDILREMSD